MKNNAVVKKNKKKDGTISETIYNIDADFIPSAINEICIEFIEAYCEANNKIEWLVETVSKKKSFEVPVYAKGKKDKDGNKIQIGTKVRTVDYPFVSIRADFVNEFFPSILKGEPEKELTIKEKILAKYGKK